MELTPASDHPVFQHRDVVLYIAGLLPAQATVRLSIVGKQLYKILHSRVTQLYCENKHPELCTRQVHWICQQDKPRDCVDGVVCATQLFTRLGVPVDIKGDGTGCDSFHAGAWLASSFTQCNHWVQACPNLDEKALASLYAHSREGFASIYVDKSPTRSKLLAQIAVNFVLRGWLESLVDDRRREDLILQLVADLGSFQLAQRKEALQKVMEQIGRRPKMLDRCLARFFSSGLGRSACCPATLEALLSNGADVHSLDERGKTIGERAWRKVLYEEKARAALRVCIRYGDRTLHKQALQLLEEHAQQLELVNFLYEVGAYRVGMRDPDGLGALHYLAYSRHVEVTVIERVLELGEEADARDEKGVSPLQVAMVSQLSNRLPKILDTLAAHGADRQPVTKDGSTTLHLVCKSLKWADGERISQVIKFCGGVLSTDMDGKRPLHYLASQCEQDPDAWASIAGMFIAAGETFWEENRAFEKWSAEGAFLLAVGGGWIEHLRQWPTGPLPLEHHYRSKWQQNRYAVHMAAGNADTITLHWLAKHGADLKPRRQAKSLAEALCAGLSTTSNEKDIVATVRFLREKGQLPDRELNVLLTQLVGTGLHTAFFDITKNFPPKLLQVAPGHVNWLRCSESEAEELLRYLAEISPQWRPKHWNMFNALGGPAVAMMARVKREWLLLPESVKETCKYLSWQPDGELPLTANAKNLLAGLRAVKSELHPDEWLSVSEGALAALLHRKSLFRAPLDVLKGIFDLFLDEEQLYQDRGHLDLPLFELFRMIGKEGINKEQWQLLRSHLDAIDICFGDHSAFINLCEPPSRDAIDSPMMEEYLEVAPQVIEWISQHLSKYCEAFRHFSPLANAAMATEFPKLSHVLTKALLKQGFSVKDTNDKFKSALRIACENGDRECVMLMLATKPELEEREKRDLLRYARESGNLRLLFDIDAHFDQ